MSNVRLIEHPVIADRLATMRDEKTDSATFRRLLKEISIFLAYEMTRELPVKEVTVRTPVADAQVAAMDKPDITVIPILRAGLGMLDGFLDVLPQAKVRHLGMARDESSHKPVPYYSNLGETLSGSLVLMVDPMLATGGSAIDAVNSIKAAGAQEIMMANLLCAPAGIEAFTAAHPDVDIYTAAIDERLNENAFIVPGLGDAGDRIFNS